MELLCATVVFVRSHETTFEGRTIDVHARAWLAVGNCFCCFVTLKCANELHATVIKSYGTYYLSYSITDRVNLYTRTRSPNNKQRQTSLFIASVRPPTYMRGLSPLLRFEPRPVL